MSSPRPLTDEEQQKRLDRVVAIARRFGFVGRIEYRHVFTQSGGAQYGRANVEEMDLLVVYAEAFERDADPNDFSLEAMIAHERGHQLLARHPRISAWASRRVSERGEEVIASLLGKLLCDNPRDRDTLMGKASFEVMQYGMAADVASQRLEKFLTLLRALL